MGVAAIRSAMALPGLQLMGLVTPSPAKAGQDASTFAGLDVPLHTSLPAEVEALGGVAEEIGGSRRHVTSRFEFASVHADWEGGGLRFLPRR